MAQTPPSCALFAVDIVGSTQYPGRLHISLRKALHEIVWTSLERAGVSRHEDVLRIQDEGDAFAVVLNDRSTARLIEAVVEMNKEIHRKGRDFDPPLQMRAAVHHGPLDPSGSGTARIDLARMLDSAELRRELDDSGGNVAVMISDDVYRTVVRDGYTATVAPADFRPVDIRVKQTELRGWVHAPAPPSGTARRREIIGAVAAGAMRYLKKNDMSGPIAKRSATAPASQAQRVTWAKAKKPPREPPLAPTGEMPPTHSVIAFDLRGYSKYQDVSRPLVRQALRDAIGSAMGHVGIAWDPDEQSDRVRSRDDGDGYIVILGDGDMARLVDLVPRLSRELHRYDRRFDPPLEMRVAVHHGPIDSSGSGITKIELARMLGSDVLRQELDESRSNVALIVSDHVYRAAVDGGYTEALGPAEFRRRDIQVKQTAVAAWVCTPSSPAAWAKIAASFGKTVPQRKTNNPGKFASRPTEMPVNPGIQADWHKPKDSLRTTRDDGGENRRRRPPFKRVAGAFTAATSVLRGPKNERGHRRTRERTRE